MKNKTARSPVPPSSVSHAAKKGASSATSATADTPGGWGAWLAEAYPPEPSSAATQQATPKWLLDLFEDDPTLQPTRMLPAPPPVAAPAQSSAQRLVSSPIEDDLALQMTQVLPANPPKFPREETPPAWLADVLQAQATIQPTQIAPAPLLPTLRRDAERYAELPYYRLWLQNEFKRQNSPYSQSARASYVAQSSAPVKVRGQVVYPFAPLRGKFSALTTITGSQYLWLFLLIGLWVAGLYFLSVPALAFSILVITALYLVNTIIVAAITTHVLDAPPGETFDAGLIAAIGNDDWPIYTILCPLYREAEVVPQFVRAISAFDYPQDRLQVLLLTEQDDEETRVAIARMGLPPSFRVVTVPDGQPRTKPRACNYGLMIAKGSFIVIYDAEDIPDPLQLKKAVLAFANHDIRLACVQAKLGFYNPKQNLLTRWFAIEYALWFHVMLPGLQWARLSLPLGGTSNHFRTDVLRKLGGWDPFNVTEDCDLGLRLAQYHLRTTILDSTTMEEANSNAKNWIRQRSRWIKGYLQTYLVHLRQPWRYLIKRRFREFFSLQVLIGGSPSTFLVNPLMWALLAIYIAFRSHVNTQYELLYSAPVFYSAVLCLVFGNFLYLYIHLIACAKSQQYGLIGWVFTLPLYWIMMSIAAVMAFYQLITKPHYWEKTKHGLHLKTSQGPASQQPGGIPSMQARHG